GKKILFGFIIMCISMINISEAQTKRPTPPKPPAKSDSKPPAKKDSKTTVKPETKPVVKAPVNYKVSWGPDLKLKGDAPNNSLLYDKGSFYAITDSRGGMFSKS